MHKHNEPPYYLIHRSGLTHEFPSVRELYYFLRTVAGSVGSSHVVPVRRRNPDGSTVIYEYEWIIRDAFGYAVTEDNNIKRNSVRETRGDEYRSFSRYAIHSSCFSNGLPVPGTGRNRYRYGRTLRHPAHMSAERAHAGYRNDMRYDDDMLPYGNRKHIRLHTPPNSWDDEKKADTDIRSWKHYRRHAWK